MIETKYSAVLIDDEPKAMDELEHLLEISGKVNVVAKECKPNMGLRQIVVHRPDIVFMDVDMPEKDGISLLKEINELKISVRVVLISEHDHHVFEAFKCNAADFLLKPVISSRLNEVLERFQPLETISLRSKDSEPLHEREKLLLPSGRKSLLVKEDQILYLKADGNYSQLIIAGGSEHLLTKGLGMIEKKLPECFFRISRSIIINTHHLSALLRGKKFCLLNDGQKEYQVKASTQPFYELENRFCS